MVFIIVKIVSNLTILKDWFGCNYNDTNNLLELYNDFSSGAIDKAAPIAQSARICASAGRSKIDLTKCDPTAGVRDIVSFLGPYIIFESNAESETQETQTKTQVDAFNILMSASKKANHLPEKYANATNNKLKLFNDVIDWLGEQSAGFLSTNKGTLGKTFVNTLVDALWYIDGNRVTLESRACHLPEALKHFQDYRCPYKSKKRKIDPSCLQEPTLRSHASALLLLSDNSYLSRENWSSIKNVITDFGNALLKYSDFLVGQGARTKTNESRKVVGEKQRWEVLSGKFHIVPGPLARYQSLHTAIIHSENYSPILVNDHAPGEPNRRFDYFKGMVVTVKCVKYAYTGSKEHLVFVWKVPLDASETEILNKNTEISSELMKTLPKYHTRAMRREFLSQFGKATSSKAAFLRETYRRLTGDASASLTASESEVDERVREILDCEDPDLIWDLRVNNSGQPEKYTDFLKECQKYISAKVEVAVDERRHDKIDSDGDIITHLATAFSIRDLHEQVSNQCPDGTPIPSKEWLRYQFWPRNCHFKSSQKYTGKLKIKFMIQSRQFRSQHIDMHYASALFRYQKEFAIQYRGHTVFACMDDKHKVKVGEPGYPVAMVERGKSVLVGINQKFEVADHDFTKFSLTPSVCLIVDVPTSIEETFYGGQVYVGIKENCFEASSPWRHAAELNSILAQDNQGKPILLLYTDGGPDHRLTFGSVQMSLINLFIEKNLDMLVAVRTPPGNSWKNPAERIMSVLNLGFQSVGLMRQRTPNFEQQLKSVSSIGEIRNLADKLPIIDEVKDSVEPVKNLLKNVIHRLTWKGKNFKTIDPSLDDEINNLRDHILTIDPSLSDGSTTQHELKDKKQFNTYLETHCCVKHYMFCIKKCGKASCTVCSPPRLSQEDFESLHFLPDPEPENADKYKSFQQLYGTETSEKFRPSKTKSPELVHGVPFSPTAQTAKNVEFVIICSECEKPRVLHAKHVVRGKKRTELQDVLSDLSYQCGCTLQEVETEEGHILKSVFVRKNLTCEVNMELTYYSAGFDPVCFYCGGEDNLQTPEDKYPVCDMCLSGKKTFVQKRGRMAGKEKAK